MAQVYLYKLEKYGISKARQKELRAFCRQYEEKNRRLLYENPLPGTVDRLKAELALVDGCLLDACDGNADTELLLRENVLHGIGLRSLISDECGLVPLARLRTRFFRLLDERL